MEEIRSIFREAAHSSSGEDTNREDDQTLRPYHLATIFDTNALSNNSYNSGVTKNGAEWSNLNYLSAASGEHLLGTIAILSDREVMQSLLRHAKTAGEWAHAIFDKNGNVRYPKI